MLAEAEDAKCLPGAIVRRQQITMDETHPKSFQASTLTEPQMLQFAGILAFVLRAGDVVALRGDLGAGKTTLARAIVRSLAGDPECEVPSPTFTLVQCYDTAPTPVAHFDLYRLGVPDELDELGFEHLIENNAALIEWPERAGDRLPPDRLEVQLEDDGGSGGDGAETRRLRLVGRGNWGERLGRLQALLAIVRGCGFDKPGARFAALPGDASTRRYARMCTPHGDRALLMDWPAAPDGPALAGAKPYSQVAKLAEDVKPFLAVGQTLRRAGLAAPEILATDIDNGFLVIEDLGELAFADALAAGHDQASLWSLGVDALIALRSVDADVPMPVGNGETHTLPKLDRAILSGEVNLVIDWLWPAINDAELSQDLRDRFSAIWQPVFDRVLSAPAGIMLRDYHSPNLIFRPHERGLARVGIIDFQDALQGPGAYDLVSLLQDARLDVAPSIEEFELQRYSRAAHRSDPAFDEEAFLALYSSLGAQRATKILGIFARLAKRDGKPRYLRHMPRIWGYLERNLAHPELSPLAEWYDRAFPKTARGGELAV